MQSPCLDDDDDDFWWLEKDLMIHRDSLTRNQYDLPGRSEKIDFRNRQ